MDIPEILLLKAGSNSLGARSQEIIEKGWNYLRGCFSNEEEYFDFLTRMDIKKFEDFLYTIFFYYVHDLYRIPAEKRILNIDGFMYQATLSIIEYLNNGISGSRNRIKDFKKYFSPKSIENLKDSIKAKPFSQSEINLEFWEILYDLRNGFIHKAKWFNLIDEDSEAFASLSVIEHRNKDGSFTQYFGDIRIKFKEYEKYFWDAYLKYFNT